MDGWFGETNMASIYTTVGVNPKTNSMIQAYLKAWVDSNYQNTFAYGMWNMMLQPMVQTMNADDSSGAASAIEALHTQLLKKS